MSDLTLDDIDEGSRVELHPATDAWMQGDQYGEVLKVGRKLVHVYMDRSQRVLRLHPRWIGSVLYGPQEWAEIKHKTHEIAELHTNPWDNHL